MNAFQYRPSLAYFKDDNQQIKTLNLNLVSATLEPLSGFTKIQHILQMLLSCILPPSTQTQHNSF